MKSWKTTLAGLLGLAAVVLPIFAPEAAPLAAKIGTAATAVGLMAARDNDVSSEKAGAK
jgi:hypothetical protein